MNFRTALLLFSATCSVALQLQAQSSSILADDEDFELFFATKGDKKLVGDGPGRPLFAFNAVTVPPTPTDGSPNCIGLQVDSASGNKFTVQEVKRPIQGPEAGADYYVAQGCFQDQMANQGWDHLFITDSPMLQYMDESVAKGAAKSADTTNMPLSARLYGAGVVEGLLTYDQIMNFRKTTASLLALDIKSVKETNAANATEKAVRMSLIAWEELSGGDANTPPKDDTAKQAWIALLQMRGIRDGFNILANQKGGTGDNKPMSMYEVMLMNMHTELPGLVDVYSRSQQSKVQDAANSANSKLLQTSSSTRLRGSSPHAFDGAQKETARSIPWQRWASHMPRGSALVRRIGPMGSPEDMIAAHVAHGNYGEMLRIMKTYKLDVGTSVGKVIMSSYPACISSTDDYLITDAGFVLMSANLWVPDTSIYSRPMGTNQGLPNFLRATIATRTAVKPRQWIKTYSLLTGLAGGKQWLIADYSQLKGSQPIPDGTVFLAECMPMLTRMGDVSDLVNKNGYVTAYGMPHFRQIRDIYGLASDGPGVFKEHLGSALADRVSTISDAVTARQRLVEFNPLRKPFITEISQIPTSARNDLDLLGLSTKIPEGGLDAKLATRCLVKAMGMQAKSGPAYDGKYPAFDWSAFPSEWPHNGVPTTYNFDFYNVDQLGGKAVTDIPCTNADISSKASS